MKLTGFVPILKCGSVDRSLNFYKDTLQFVEIRTRSSAHGMEWVYLKSGNSYLMLEKSNEDLSKQNHSISLYFYTDDVRSFHQYMLAKGYSISALEKTEFGLLECTFYDLDGHKVQIAELIK